MFDGLPNVKKGCAKLSILAIRNQITFTNIKKICQKDYKTTKVLTNSNSDCNLSSI